MGDLCLHWHRRILQKMQTPWELDKFPQFSSYGMFQFYQHHICSISSFAPMMLAKMGVVLRSTRTCSGIFRATHVMTVIDPSPNDSTPGWQALVLSPDLLLWALDEAWSPSHRTIGFCRKSSANWLWQCEISKKTPLPIEDRTMQDIYTAYKYIHIVYFI